jgi:hypothetical protein
VDVLVREVGDGDDEAVGRGSRDVAPARVGSKRVLLRARKDKDAAEESVAYNEMVVDLVY